MKLCMLVNILQTTDICKTNNNINVSPHQNWVIHIVSLSQLELKDAMKIRACIDPESD